MDQFSFQGSVFIDIGQEEIEGDLAVPIDAKGVVVFSAGNTDIRFNPRIQFLAKKLQMKGLATLLFDSQIHDVEERFLQEFDLDVMTQRLIDVTHWLFLDDRTNHLRIGYFGSSVGAACSFIAASKFKYQISGIVSRGGRPDLALPFLRKVKAPTLLIVGELDEEVLKLNEKAFDFLSSTERKLIVAPGASHFFAEPGKLEQVAYYSGLWFRKHLHKEKLLAI
jgi:putative phosphoribosyl transferase